METSLWSRPADELLARTASADPTPGGGSVAALTGALGTGLVLMALAVTARRRDLDDAQRDRLADLAARGEALLARVRAGADQDVADFETLMAAYGRPATTCRSTSAPRRSGPPRSPRPAAPSTSPRRSPTSSTSPPRPSRSCTPASARTRSPGATSPAGAAWAAIRTADVNLAALERAGADERVALAARRDAVRRRLDARAAPGPTTDLDPESKETRP